MVGLGGPTYKNKRRKVLEAHGMAIVPLDKITLYGTVDQKDAVLDGLQRLGCLHLVDLGSRPEGKMAIESVSGDAREALRYLRACANQRRQTIGRKGYDVAKIDAEALEIKRREEELNDERDHLGKAIEELKPWGDFRLPAEDELGGLKLWFYVVPHHLIPKLEDIDYPRQIVAKGVESDYLVVVSSAEPEGLPVPAAQLDPRPLSELLERLEDVEEELEDLRWQRVNLTRWCTLLERDLDEADDWAARKSAASQVRREGELFAVQGWCPHSATPDVQELAKRHTAALTVEPPGPDDSPPTLLKNPERVAGAEDAVTFYMTPEYRMWDPTIVVFFSFSLFFAMIFADAGYAILLGLILFAMWGKLSATRAARRFRNLLVALVVATFGYGVLVGSYFGMAPPQLLASLKILDVQDKPTMMALSIVIGVAHLVLANLITAWRLRRSSKCLGAAGWAAILLGGLVLGAGMLGSAPILDGLASILGLTNEQFFGLLETIGATALATGGLAVLLFSSDRPLRSLKIGDWLWRLLDGVMELTGLSKAFGDVLSYLRLFALGLASAQLAGTFNGMASSAADLPGPGFLLAVLIVVLGHGVNLMLGIMSGVVHGLRLNCIEFFSWSLKEEGYPFKAFCKKAEV